MASFARLKRMAAAAGALDLAKFYEHVSHAALRREAEDLGCPGELVRLLCIGYRMPRRAKWGLTVSDELEVNGTLAAGCSCATGLAKVMMHRTLCQLARLYPTVRYQNVVDDVMIQAIGRAEEVRRQVPEAMIKLVDLLEAKDLVVAWHKTKFMASDEITAEAVRLGMKESGVALDRVTGARNLGCDTNDGRWRRIGEQDGRFRKAGKSPASPDP